MNEIRKLKLKKTEWRMKFDLISANPAWKEKLNELMKLILMKRNWEAEMNELLVVN